MDTKSTHKTKHWLPLYLGLMVVTVSPGLSQAAEAEDKGLAIATEANQRDAGFGDFKVNLKMTLRNKHNQSTSRSMRNTTREQADDGDKTLIVFDNPRDVKGTAFLSHTHKVGSDDQWLYLPALKRVKRISSSNKAGPFMGSEFAYEDISSQELEKYTYKYIADETFDGREHFKVEFYPTNPKSGYKKQVVWFDKAEYRVWKIDFYNRRGGLLKTLINSGYKQYLGKYWRAEHLNMVNHVTGKSTSLNFSGYQFSIGTTDADFTANRLKRAR